MLEAGKLLQKRYRIEKQIGQGGMGAVYVAKDERFKSTVAIKEMLFSEETYKKAFEREARLLNSLRHPALPNVSDYFSEGDGQFLVMEYIPGEDLYEKLEKTGKPFPLEKVLIWAGQLLDALDYLHNQTIPVIHRDIKPQNLKLTSNNQIILLDFGLAKGNPTDVSHHTASKSIFGYSPGYASLEQIQGTGTDPRSDLYSLAATLYHLLTGTPPTDALTRAMNVLSERDDPLKAAHLVSDEIPPGVSEVLRRAMSLNANQRPASVKEMRELLDERDKITVFDDAKTHTAGAMIPSSIHNQETQVLGESTVSAKQTDFRTNVISGAPAENVSKVTKFAAINDDKAKGQRPRNPFVFAASIFGILLIFGLGIYGFYFYQPQEIKNADQSPIDANNKIQNEAIELTDTNAVNAERANPDPDDYQTETNAAILENSDNPTQNQLPEKPKETVKGETQTKNSNTKTVVIVNPDEEKDELIIGNMKINDDGIETDEYIIKDDKVIFKKPSQKTMVKTPPHLTPEQLERLTPEQRRKLQRAREMQRRLKMNPPKPPPQPSPEH